MKTAMLRSACPRAGSQRTRRRLVKCVQDDTINPKYSFTLEYTAVHQRIKVEP